ncbi:MAG: lysozyme [Actinomycetota bacterium]|jgi:GH25 family lysozyme M1 (1,4-beta-N-acetylmuramidase)|nr:lysozyme [Actinomycetota bacterium]
MLAASPARAQSYTLGIDVSHWQEENGNVINWQKVSETHVFAFHKATEGTTYADPRYADNRTEAASASIPFGAYHFARPSGGTIAAAQQDGVDEADHFLAVAQPAAGDLIPVLDLEANGNLPTRRLKAWVQSWLDRVRSVVGVEPMIYTGPNFWESYMGNTAEFAAYPLWIAHYTSDAPRVPGGNWGGNGWAFWQWTSSAQVPGIKGGVDEDRFAGTDLTPYKIPGAPLPVPTPDPATPPSNQSPPTISGDTEVGSTLAADEGTWSGSTPQSYSYAWYRCDADGSSCADIAGGTDPSYELAPGDFGHRLMVRVTATNSAASSSEDSAPSETITDTVAPGSPVMTAPRSQPTLATTMEASWNSIEPGVSAFDVRYRATTPRSGFADFESVLGDSEAKETTVDVNPGSTYCFSARAIDEAGNRSNWSGERCSAVPMDDPKLRSVGFVRRTGDAFFLSTVSSATRMDAELTATDVRARDIYLVASRCRGCGKVAVSFNGKRLATVDLAAKATANQRVIHVSGFAAVRSGTIRIRVISRNLPVKIDGLLLALQD